MLGHSWFHRSIEQGRELRMDDHNGHVCTSGGAALRGKVPSESPSGFSSSEVSAPVPTLILHARVSQFIEWHWCGPPGSHAVASESPSTRVLSHVRWLHRRDRQASREGVTETNDRGYPHVEGDQWHVRSLADARVARGFFQLRGTGNVIMTLPTRSDTRQVL